MLIIPAIDIKDGKCVRLFQGKYNKVEIFSENPADIAKKWVSLGAKFIHIVDLDGAKKGKLCNEEIIKNSWIFLVLSIIFYGNNRLVKLSLNLLCRCFKVYVYCTSWCSRCCITWYIQ